MYNWCPATYTSLLVQIQEGTEMVRANHATLQAALNCLVAVDVILCFAPLCVGSQQFKSQLS